MSYSMRHRHQTAAATLAFALALALSATGHAGAQTVRRSQLGTVTQRIGTTDVAVVYRRPVARGRTLFGGLVPWGRAWTPGADSATTIAFSHDVLVDGHELAAGTYSLWAIPEPDAWTMIFSKAQPVFHIPYPEGEDVLRVTAKPATGAHMEVLTFYFPIVEPDSAILALHWGTTVVPLSIRVR